MTMEIAAVIHGCGLGQTECQSDQDKGEGVLAVLTEIGVRPICRRTERGEGHRGGQDPGE